MGGKESQSPTRSRVSKVLTRDVSLRMKVGSTQNVTKVGVERQGEGIKWTSPLRLGHWGYRLHKRDSYLVGSLSERRPPLLGRSKRCEEETDFYSSCHKVSDVDIEKKRDSVP